MSAAARGRRESGGGKTLNVIIADYTDLADKGLRPEQLLAIGKPQRDALEHKVATEVAAELLKRLPRTPEESDSYRSRPRRQRR